MRRIHKNRKTYKRSRIIIFSILFISLISLTVGYSTFNTKLSMNAKGNLKEMNAAKYLKTKSVTSGDGLYKDEYENDKYIFKGNNPNNWLKLGGMKFRILSIDADDTLKIIYADDFITLVYDPGYETYLSNNLISTQPKSIEGTRYSSDKSNYCYSDTEESYEGCRVWGSKTTTLDSTGISVSTMSKYLNNDYYTLPDTEAYLNKYLNNTWYNSLSDTNKNLISKHLFNIGPTDTFSSNSLSENIKDEKSYQWYGNVGLLTATEYTRTTTNKECKSVYDYNQKSDCYSTALNDNWIYKIANLSGKDTFTITSVKVDNSSQMWVISNGKGSLDGSSGYQNVLPVLYLKSNIKLFGSGTEEDPYLPTIIE